MHKSYEYWDHFENELFMSSDGPEDSASTWNIMELLLHMILRHLISKF